MKIIETSGDIFKSEAEIIVNTVNTVGVMGKGLALEFAKRFPSMVPEYQKACVQGDLRIGKCQIWEVPDNYKWFDYNNLLYVVNFPTKQHWRYSSQYEWISQGLESLSYDLLELQSVENKSTKLIHRTMAIPALGCSLGGLDWDRTRSIIIDKIVEKFNWFEEIKLFSPYK